MEKEYQIKKRYKFDRYFWRSNQAYFWGYFAFLATLLFLMTQIETGDAVFFFSEHRSFATDSFFKFGSLAGEEWSYLILTFLLLTVATRKAIVIPFTGIIVAVVANLAKQFFAQPRPKAYFESLGIWDQMNVVEGVYIVSSSTSSFPSGHTMSGFALFTLVALMAPKKGVKFLFLFLAMSTGIARIYLSQHFIKDVALGSFMGLCIGIGMFFVSERIGRHQASSRWNHPLFKS